MGTDETKLCKLCYMEISSKAKKCPYCQHWQFKWALVTFNPAFIMLPVIIISYGFIWFMFSGFFEGKLFSSYTNSISINDTEMLFGMGGSESKTPTVIILGNISNDSDITWEDIILEVKFFDANGKMIDTEQEDKYSYILPAKKTSSFKLSIRREFPTEKYSDFEISIISAKDEKGLFL